MKNQKPVSPKAPRKAVHFRRSLRLYLESDLVDPGVEAGARSLLREIREAGYAFSGPDLEDSRCLACLDLALGSALLAVQ